LLLLILLLILRLLLPVLGLLLLMLLLLHWLLRYLWLRFWLLLHLHLLLLKLLRYVLLDMLLDICSLHDWGDSRSHRDGSSGGIPLRHTGCLIHEVWSLCVWVNHSHPALGEGGYCTGEGSGTFGLLLGLLDHSSAIPTRCSLPDSSHYWLNSSDIDLLKGEHRGAGTSNGGTCVVQAVYEDVLQYVHSF
jgi:hypothetical protein